MPRGFLYLCLHPLTQNDENRHDNTCGEGRVLGGQPRHCICTNASRGLSATAECLAKIRWLSAADEDEIATNMTTSSHTSTEQRTSSAQSSHSTPSPPAAATTATTTADDVTTDGVESADVDGNLVRMRHLSQSYGDIPNLYNDEQRQHQPQNLQFKRGASVEVNRSPLFLRMIFVLGADSYYTSDKREKIIHSVQLHCFFTCGGLV